MRTAKLDGGTKAVGTSTRGPEHTLNPNPELGFESQLSVPIELKIHLHYGMKEYPFVTRYWTPWVLITHNLKPETPKAHKDSRA